MAQGFEESKGARVINGKIGCGFECNEKHTGDATCLVCDKTWVGYHIGHTCNEGDKKGKRGAWAP